ncbi:MAG: M14 family zinc carboxypeptidase [Longimicrobiales bacterium]
MSKWVLLLAGLSWAACASPPDEAEGSIETPIPRDVPPAAPDSVNPDMGVSVRSEAVAARGRDLAGAYSATKASGLDERRFTSDEYWAAFDPVLADKDGLRVTTIGRSAEGRPLRMIRLGDGAIPVLLWSQMHGNESTASMALVDVVNFLTTRRDHPTARAIHQALDVAIVPMLNPDGAERFQRRNAQGIDINRDARALQTPEGQALKRVRDDLEPEFAFNLHDQQVGTRVGTTSRGAAIALLAPPQDESRRVTPARGRAFRVSSVIRDAIEPFVQDHISKYDDTFNPRAFGDLITQWGASTILIESGSVPDDPQKQELRRINFVAILAALESIADGSYQIADPDRYHDLPYNGRSLADLVIRGGTLRIPGLPDLRADLLISYDEPLLETGGVITDIGDLRDVETRDTIDATGLYLLALDEALTFDEDGTAHLPTGAPAYLIASPLPDGSVPEWDFRGHFERTRR